MVTETPLPPPEPVPVAIEAEASPQLPMAQRPDGTLVIDLTALVPPVPSADCLMEEPDPFSRDIVVCEARGPSPRLGLTIGPVDGEFGSAIPRARIRLSETASAEANLSKTPVGGFDADGAEVRVKFDF